MNTKDRREILKLWVLESLIDLGGAGSLLEVTRQVWMNHGSEIDGDFFFTWQYDLRWASQALANDRRVLKKDGEWSLNLAEKSLDTTTDV